MDPFERLELLRNFVRSYFERISNDSDEQYSENILLRDEHYCGRRFRYGAHSAVWFAEEDEVKFYDGKGQLLEAISQIGDRAQAGDATPMGGTVIGGSSRRAA